MFLCSVLHNTYTFFKYLKFENITSFILHTFHLIHLARDRSKFSMFCPSQYLYFFKDLKFENIPSFVLHTFHLVHLARDRRKFSMFCPPQYLNFFHGFGYRKYFKFCPPSSIFNFYFDKYKIPRHFNKPQVLSRFCSSYFYGLNFEGRNGTITTHYFSDLLVLFNLLQCPGGFADFETRRAPMNWF